MSAFRQKNSRFLQMQEANSPEMQEADDHRTILKEHRVGQYRTNVAVPILNLKTISLFPPLENRLEYYMGLRQWTSALLRISSSNSSDSRFPADLDTLRRSGARLRLPSVEERLEYYMGGWGLNVTMLSGRSNSSFHLRRGFESRLCDNKRAKFHQPQILTPSTIHRSSCWHGLKFTKPFQPPPCPRGTQGNLDIYLRDALAFLHIEMSANGSSLENYGGPEACAIFEFGDTRTGPVPFPVVVKSRRSKEGPFRPSALLPILWPLNAGRHWNWRTSDLSRYHRPPWNQKRDVLIFRGASTGRRYDFVKQWNHRRRDIDVGFSEVLGSCQKDRDCKSLQKASLSPEKLLEHKYLLFLEGNDVSSGLKWALYSNSVVFMARPTVASWAMEDWLVPYVHYIPLNGTYADVASQLDWAKENPIHCLFIARESTRFMDKVFVDDSARKDEEHVKTLIREAYHKAFSGRLDTYCH